LSWETGVSCNRDTVLACHGYHDVTVVVEDGLEDVLRVEDDDLPWLFLFFNSKIT
jgi:hypothetical protein